MMAADGTPHDSVDPAPQSFGSFEGVQARVNHDKNFLDDIVNGVCSNAKPPNGGPNEIEVLPVNGFEWRHFGR
jgi:hypothetical protein